MKKFKYNGVLIEVSEKAPHFTHSVPLMIMSFGKIESNENIPFFEKLMTYKETEIPQGELLHDVCALNSIRNLNYQVNNGGIEQYYDNGYHLYRAGQEIGDLANIEMKYQVSFLKKLIDFILYYEDNKKYADDLYKALSEMETQRYNIYNNAFSKVYNDFDSYWYKVSEIIEWGIEYYAQYLIKRLEVEDGNTNQ